MDDAATTSVNSRVLKAMMPFFTEEYGNPSSQHEIGELARRAIDNARQALAKEINAKPWEIYFTSGATESNNWVFQGLTRVKDNITQDFNLSPLLLKSREYSKRQNRGDINVSCYKYKNKIIISEVEHASVLEPCSFLEKNGYNLIKIQVDKNGFVNLTQLENEIDKNVLVVSVMHVNNVIGTIQDIEAIGMLCKKKGVLFHTDASQSFGKLLIDVRAMNVDLLSAGAHKLGGPKGVGLLYIRDGIDIEPLIYGGGQERGMRGGTENVAGVVGFAMAFDEMKKVNQNKIRVLREYIIQEIEKIGGVINGSRSARLYNNVHASFKGVDGGTLVEFLSQKGIYVSTGSACDSRKEKEDYVLRAIGLSKEAMNSSIRITLPSGVTKEECNAVLRALEKGIRVLRR